MQMRKNRSTLGFKGHLPVKKAFDSVWNVYTYVQRMICLLIPFQYFHLLETRVCVPGLPRIEYVNLHGSSLFNVPEKLLSSISEVI